MQTVSEIKEDLDLKSLEHFYGTTAYYKVGLVNALVTDGVKYIMENGYSWFVTDALAVMKFKPKLRREPFLVVRLELGDEKTATMVITDGNYGTLYKQEYKYTDAKRELRLFFTDNVLMLAGEY